MCENHQTAMGEDIRQHHISNSLTMQILQQSKRGVKSEKEHWCLAGSTTKSSLLYGSSCITIQSAHVSTREKQKMVLSKSVMINIMKHLMTATQTSSQRQVRGVTSVMQTVSTLILWLLILLLLAHA